MSNILDNVNPFISKKDKSKDHPKPPPPKQAVYDEENPFMDEKVTPAAPPARPSTKSMSDDALRDRIAELEAREASLKAREDLMKNKEKEFKQLKEQMARDGYKPNNWPSKCYPIAYHDINADIPEQKRRMVKMFYACVIATWIGLLWNWLENIIFWGMGDGSFSDTLWSTIYVVLGIPGSWRLWYMALYQGSKSSGTFKWLGFFINFGLHLLMCVVIGVGLPFTAGGGLLVFLKHIALMNKTQSIISIITTVYWLILFLYSSYLYKRAYAQWKSGGGSISKASLVAAAV